MTYGISGQLQLSWEWLASTHPATAAAEVTLPWPAQQQNLTSMAAPLARTDSGPGQRSQVTCFLEKSRRSGTEGILEPAAESEKQVGWVWLQVTMLTRMLWQARSSGEPGPWALPAFSDPYCPALRSEKNLDD